MIEDEFYDIEDYTGVEDFKAKGYAYQLYFNFKGNKRYKGRKAPIEIPKEAGSSISPQVFNLPPVILDNFLYELIEHGYHVGSSYTPPGKMG